MGRPRVVSDDAILRAVAEVVDERGPGGLTFAAVAARVGVTPPAIRQRFGSRRGLLEAFGAAQPAAVASTFATAREAGPGPLEAAIAGLVALAGRPDRRAFANHLALLGLDVGDDALRAHAAAHAQEVRAQVTALVEEARREGDPRVPAGPTSAVVADVLVTTYNGALVGWAVEGTGDLADWVVTRLERVLHLDDPAVVPVAGGTRGARGRRSRGRGSRSR